MLSPGELARTELVYKSFIVLPEHCLVWHRVCLTVQIIRAERGLLELIPDLHLGYI